MAYSSVKNEQLSLFETCFEAILKRDEETLRKSLENAKETDISSYKGVFNREFVWYRDNERWCFSLLHIACARSGNERIVDLLLAHGADPDWQDEVGNTALTAAIRHRHSTLVCRLLRAGASTTLVDKYGKTALCHAKEVGLFECVDIIKQSKINRELVVACTQGDYASVVKSLDSGRPVNANFDMFDQLTPGSTMLTISTFAGHERIVELLLQHRAAVNLQNSHGSTALMIASAAGYLQIVNILLEHGATVHTQNSRGQTALYFATFNNHFSIVRRLLQAGAARELDDKDNNTALRVTIVQACGLTELDDKTALRVALEQAGAASELDDKDNKTALRAALEQSPHLHEWVDDVTNERIAEAAAMGDELIAQEEQEKSAQLAKVNARRAKKRAKKARKAAASMENAASTLPTVDETSTFEAELSAPTPPVESLPLSELEEALPGIESEVDPAFDDMPESSIGGQTTCIICFAGEKTHMSVPCYHQCVCESCSKRLSKCPYCREDVAMWAKPRVV